MSGPGWISQEVPALGAITSAGIRNALGRPAIDRLTVLLRESAQNSWDAGLAKNRTPVRYSVELTTLEPAMHSRWTTTFAETPAMHGVAVPGARPDKPARVMFIADRGTSGLGGPTRADVPAEKGDHDYVSLVLNIGDPRDTELGGGTFGYGKAVYFTTARTGVVIVHTRCRVGGQLESRLIGMGLGEPHSFDGRNYTGRHWWGIADHEGVEPLRNRDADTLAAVLGFPGFAHEETGTTIAIVDPELEGRTPRRAGEWIAQAILWHLWPKMLPGEANVEPMRFDVTVDGEAIPVPSPDKHPATRLFARVIDELDTGGAGEPIASGNPKRHLGTLHVAKTFEPLPALDEVAEEALGARAVHHACLLRSPRLVVEYRPGPPPIVPEVWYAGVFLADDELDGVFARAEPPTHDAWISSQLQGAEKTFVNRALTQIRERLQAFNAPVEGHGQAAEGPPLGAASRYLASLLGDTTGQGAGPTAGGGGGVGVSRAVRLLGDPIWEALDGNPVLAQRVEVTGTKPVTVEPRLAIGLWGGGTETDRPADDAGPAFLAWRSPDGTVSRDPTIAFTAADAGEWTLLVKAVDDTVTSISLRTATREEPT